MTDHFDSPKEVLSNARDHINDLHARINAFFERKPYAPVIDYDHDTGQDVHKIRLTAKLPGKAIAVAKDALSNLRDCLDHAVYASACTLKPGKAITRTAFPFAYDAAGVHDKLNREFIDISPEIRTLLEGLCPHKTGNQLLWGLNAARNVKTHRVLVPLAAAAMGNTLSAAEMNIVGGGQFGYSRWDAAKNEVEYLRVGRGSKVKNKVDMSFSVLFGDVEVFGGKDAVATLNAAAGEVQSILLAIEAETCRILRGA